MTTWSNTTNRKLYNKLPPEEFRNLAMECGLDSCFDVKELSKYISEAGSILEVGAGYGRVLDCIIATQYEGELYAVERIGAFCELLRTKFENRVHVIQEDIFKLQLDYKFDLILWLWSGISDFSRDEQPKALAALSKHLSKNGKIVIDQSSPERLPKEAYSIGGRSYAVPTKYGDVYVYCPSLDEIAEYIELAGLEEIERIDYVTTTEGTRMLHVLSKKS